MSASGQGFGMSSINFLTCRKMIIRDLCCVLNCPERFQDACTRRRLLPVCLPLRATRPAQSAAPAANAESDPEATAIATALNANWMLRGHLRQEALHCLAQDIRGLLLLPASAQPHGLSADTSQKCVTYTLESRRLVGRKLYRGPGR